MTELYRPKQEQQGNARMVGSITWNNSFRWAGTGTAGTYADFTSNAAGDDLPREVIGDVVDSSAGLLPQVTVGNFKRGYYTISFNGSLSMPDINGASTPRTNFRVTTSTGISSKGGEIMTKEHTGTANIRTGQSNASYTFFNPTDNTDVIIKFQSTTWYGGVHMGDDDASGGHAIFVHFTPLEGQE